MVNETRDDNSVRSRLLALLRNADGPLSGEVLARELDMTRVAVWKHIRALGAHGYVIAASNRGYYLERCPDDSVLPWDIAALAGKVTHFVETDSTMNRALEDALAGAESGALYVADRQRAGRGTSGKRWESAEGGLFFTLVLRPPLHPAHYFRAVTAAQCALVETLRSLGIDAAAAWPNDVLVPDADGRSPRKAGGILSEHLCSGNSIRFLNLGIGMNTGAAPVLPGSAAVPVPRRELLEGFLARLAADGPEAPGLESRWNALSAHAGRRVRYRSGEGVAEGDFLGIDRFGNARIAPPGNIGKATGFPPGSVTILNKGSVP